MAALAATMSALAEAMSALAAAVSALAVAMSALAVAMAPLAAANSSLADATAASFFASSASIVERVESHQHLTRLHEVTLVHQNFLDPERLLSGGVGELGFDTAVAGRDPLGQGRLL